MESGGVSVAMAGTSNGYTFSDVGTGSFATTYNSLYHGILNITNNFGVTASYRVFRTEYQISSPLTVTSKDSL